MLWLLCCAALVAAARGALAPHPRLILTPARLLDVQAFIANNSQAQAYYRSLSAQGEYVLGTTPLPRPPLNASDILMAARTVLTRVYVTALLFRLTGNQSFAARATAELTTFTAWSDWDLLKHALDAGELCHAAAIGYDWLHGYLAASDPAALAAIAAGLAGLGLAPFRAAYEQPHHYWWVCDSSNWSQVTNSGAGLAALALLGEPNAPPWLPALLANATRGALCSAAPGLAAQSGGGYSPDGAWWEGPIYSGYALRYFLPFAAATETALGDASLFTTPGLLQAPAYQTLAMDASWRYFNLGDAEQGQETLANLLALAARAGDAASAWSLRARLDAAAIPLADIDTGGQDAMEYAHALLYFSDLGSTPAARAALPLDAALPMKKSVYLRSSWTDPNATFVGLKASNCSWNHGDLDSGTWVFSARGQRFVEDLGADNYALPGYFGAQRFSYYRKGSRGHNVLSFSGAPHDSAHCAAGQANATATFLTAFASDSGRAFPAPPGHALGACALAPGEAACAALDLGPAFALQGIAAAARRFGLSADRSVLSVRDSWRAGARGAPANATSSLHTLAAVAVAGDAQSAVLALGGERIGVRLGALAPGCAGRAAATPVRLAPPQYATEGLTRLDFVVEGQGCEGMELVIGEAA